MKGLVLRSTGSWYEVLAEDQKTYSCRTKGKLRLDDTRETNPVAVGDNVEFEETDAVISGVLPRKNHILRQAVKKAGHNHVLAANVDQVMLIATMKLPRTSTGFIDRFLTSAESFRIPQVVVFNKTDLLDDEEQQELNGLISLYKGLTMQTLGICAIQDDITSIADLLNGRITLLAGHSGVGKSTLLNRLSPDIGQQVRDISGFSNKGVHTTTFAEMFRLADKTFIIDTPGVKEWGLVDMDPQEISDYFPEMRERRLTCKFGARCLHISEPHCAIRAAVASGEIAESRYNSYLSMAKGDDRKK